MSTVSAGPLRSEEQKKIFPWGSNNPTRVQRVIVALCAAALGIAWLMWQVHNREDYRADFGMVWFGARTILAGGNPYELVGPGLPFHWGYPLLYPGTALVLGVPFAWLSEYHAALVFVGVSCFLLSYGMTRNSWHLLPILASEPFAQSARAAQWSLLLTAALYLPWLASLAVVKPQAGLPVVAAASRRGLQWSVGGGLVLLAASLAFFPAWPGEWLSLVQEADHMTPRITGYGGFLLLLLLFRWRRPEAWLILTLAVLPQTLASYSLLLLLTVASTFREAAALAIISTIGSLTDPYLVGHVQTMEELRPWLSTSELLTGYFPAAFLVLRRENTGEPPAWLALLIRLARRVRVRSV